MSLDHLSFKNFFHVFRCMSLQETDYRGDENIGYYAVVTDGYAVFARDFKHRDLFQEHPHKNMVIGGTRLIGLFAAGNSYGLVVPDIVSEREEQALHDADIDHRVVTGKYTALGNLVLCNDQGCLLSPYLADKKEEFSDVLEVPVETGTVAGLNIVGSCGVATNHGVLLHRNTAPDELAQAEAVLGVEGDIGSVNFGSPYVHSGLLANSRDVLIGPNTTGPETQRIQDALGFL